MWNDKRLSRIIELESILTDAIYKGHKSTREDQYKDIRSELSKLRSELGIDKHSNQNKKENA
jgi:hypothetical protein